MKIKMVHADNMEELFAQVSEVDKAQDIDDELHELLQLLMIMDRPIAFIAK